VAIKIADHHLLWLTALRANGSDGILQSNRDERGAAITVSTALIYLSLLISPPDVLFCPREEAFLSETESVSRHLPLARATEHEPGRALFRLLVLPVVRRLFDRIPFAPASAHSWDRFEVSHPALAQKVVAGDLAFREALAKSRARGPSNSVKNG
jgi:hypothetical protein